MRSLNSVLSHGAVVSCAVHMVQGGLILTFKFFSLICNINPKE